MATALPFLMVAGLVLLFILSSDPVGATDPAEEFSCNLKSGQGCPELKIDANHRSRFLRTIDRCRLCRTLPCQTGVHVTCARGPGNYPCSCCGARNCVKGASGCVLHTPKGDSSCGF